MEMSNNAVVVVRRQLSTINSVVSNSSLNVRRRIKKVSTQAMNTTVATITLNVIRRVLVSTTIATVSNAVMALRVRRRITESNAMQSEAELTLIKRLVLVVANNMQTQVVMQALRKRIPWVSSQSITSAGSFSLRLRKKVTETNWLVTKAGLGGTFARFQAYGSNRIEVTSEEKYRLAGDVTYESWLS